MVTIMEALESTYFDRCDVKRLVATETAWGETVQTYQTVLTNIQCALSQAKKTAAFNTIQNDINTIQHGYSLFINPSHEIKAGDFIEVRTEANQTFRLTAGMPFRYVTHQELPCEVREDA